MKSSSNNLEQKLSCGRVFYNRLGRPVSKLQFRARSVTAVKNNSGSGFLCSELLFKLFLYVLPVVLFFSYYPVISLGGNATMNFELSLPLLWLVGFDVLVALMMVRRKTLLKGLKGKWAWLVLPVWLTVTVIWSLNSLRGWLTVGILWLIYFAGYGMWSMRGLFDAEMRTKWWKWFMGATLVACAWCVVQCILDINGVGREYSLMCAGCVSEMFGFPHPNGFAIEPQFMGNLLLAPTLVLGWLILKDDHGSSRKPFRILLLAVFAATLFLTFSRGAIYAFGVVMVGMTVLGLARAQKKERKVVAKRVGAIWGAVVVAFLVTLNLQGLMAQLGPTEDTYQTGVAKVLNHLSLGIIDVREGDEGKTEKAQWSRSEEMEVVGAGEEIEMVVENSVENSEKPEAVFDGYVAESTDTRLRLTESAMEAWRRSPVTMMFGVGLGGAGWALYNNGLSPAPKEIVQNEYASLLLETGLVGMGILVFTIFLIVRAVWKQIMHGDEMVAVVLVLMMGYGVSLLFFSGLANALQIYLMPMVIYMVLRKKLVS